jgi:hypothetical protein
MLDAYAQPYILNLICEMLNLICLTLFVDAYAQRYILNLVCGMLNPYMLNPYMLNLFCGTLMLNVITSFVGCSTLHAQPLYA